MKKIIFLFLFICTGANSAQLVGSEITLCTNGFSPDGSTCTTYGAGECGVGYYDLTSSATSFVSTTAGGVCNVAGYKARTLPDTTIELIYHGAVIGSEITLCANGYSPNGTTCTTYGVGDCSADYYDVKAGATTFVSSVNDSCSVAGYKSRTLPDTTIELIYYGMVVGSEILLCDNGYSPDNSTCTTYQQNDCPSEYYGINAGGTSFATTNNGSCASGYHSYIAEDSCGFEPAGSTCISYCENGDMTTGAGGCSTLCGAGATTLRTSTGLKYPLWATKQTTPSINIGFPSGERCYVNLTEEATDSQAIWIRLNGTKMHAMK